MTEKKMGRPIQEDAKYTTANGNTRYYSAKKAIEKYSKANYDQVTVRLPKGTSAKIKEKTGKAMSTFLRECAMAELEKISEGGKNVDNC